MKVADAVSVPPISSLISFESLCTTLPMRFYCPQPEPESPFGGAALAVRTLCLLIQKARRARVHVTSGAAPKH